jgi:hypothetical protein
VPDNSAKSPEDECKEERNNAFETLNRDQAEYDKQLLALSAAFLGVSLAFVKDVVPLKDTTHLWVFDAALGCLLACICLVLGTFQYSIHGHFRLMDYWDLRGKRLQASEDEEKTKLDNELTAMWSWLNSKAGTVKSLNRLSGVLFGVGTIFLVIFVMVNMHHAADSSPTLSEPPKQTASPVSSSDSVVHNP